MQNNHFPRRDVHYTHFIGATAGCAGEIMPTFLWLDEDDRSAIHLFQLVRNPDKCNASDDKSVRYYDNEFKWRPPIQTSACRTMI